MPEAARLTDPVGHTWSLLGLIGGALLGAVIGAAIVFTGGAAAGALAAAATIGGATSLGSMVGQFAGSLSGPSFGGGPITGIGSPNVIICGLPAARATIDFAMCANILSHPGSLIAQGSLTVGINGFPAARKEDKLVCSAEITKGCRTVIIGAEPGTFLPLEPEVPAWLEYSMMALGLLSGVGVLRLGAGLTWMGVARVMGAGILGSVVGSEGLGWLGGKIFGQGSRGQKVMGFLGGLLGGLLAGGRAYRSKAVQTPRILRRMKYDYDLTPGVDTGQPILFGQKGVSPSFSSKGRFKGAKIDDVVADLKSGKLTPDDLPVEYIWVNGEKVVVNNRSLTTLTKAGMKPTKTVDMTGKLPKDGPDSLESVLTRLEEMGGKPSRSSNIRATDERDSPVAEQVTLPD